MTSQVIQIAHNAVTAKVYNAPRDIRLQIGTWLSYRIFGAEHTDAYKAGRWDGRSTFFDFKTDKFPAGFVNFIYEGLVNQGHTVQLVRKPLPEPLGNKKPVVDNFPDDPRYDYQQECVDNLLKYGQMIAQIATGGGKSRIARMAYKRIARPTLFLTTRSVLMYQMKDNFEKNLKNESKAGVMGDSEWSPNNHFNVGMIQTLSQRIEKKNVIKEVERYFEALKNAEDKEIDQLKRRQVKNKVPPMQRREELNKLKAKLKAKRPSAKLISEEMAKKVTEHNKRRIEVLKTLEIFELVILEEAHESGGKGYYEVLKHCKNANYRLALTATPFMKEDEEANMRLMACSGPIGIQVSEKMLIERGILAKPYFKFIQTPNPGNVLRSEGWASAYKDGIVENVERNRLILSEAMVAKSINQPCMILVQHKAHGKKLEKMCRDAKLRAKFIFGESNKKERQAALDQLGSNKLDVVIGSTILDMGVDVPAVGVVILAGGGKAEVNHRQRIGRGLREKKKGPNVAYIVDFNDRFNNKLAAHSLQRRQIIEDTPGFAENILKPFCDDLKSHYESLTAK